MDSTSDSSSDIADAFNVQPKQEEFNGQPKQEEFSNSLKIESLSKNLEEEGEWVPITLEDFYNMSPRSTDSREYEFDSLSEATTEKDIDQVHVYESQFKMGETSRVMSNEYEPTSVLMSSLMMLVLFGIQTHQWMKSL